MALEYKPTVWKNRVVKRPRTYVQTNNADGSVTLVPAPGEIQEAGTPLNEDNLNHMEQGIANCTDGINSLDEKFGAHTHDASEIDRGTLPVNHGGTGRESVTAGNFLVGNGTDAMVEKTPDEMRTAIDAAESGHAHGKITNDGKIGTSSNQFLTTTTSGAITTSTSKRVMELLGAQPAVTASTTDLTAGSSALETGKVYLVYE